MRNSLHHTLWLLLLGTLGSQVWAHATLDISVNAQAPTPLNTKQQLDERINRYLAFLRTEGLARSDVEADSLVSRPRYQVDNTGEQRLDAYSVRLTPAGNRSPALPAQRPALWREQVRDQALAKRAGTTLNPVYRIRYIPPRALIFSDQVAVAYRLR